MFILCNVFHLVKFVSKITFHQHVNLLRCICKLKRKNCFTKYYQQQNLCCNWNIIQVLSGACQSEFGLRTTEGTSFHIVACPSHTETTHSVWLMFFKIIIYKEQELCLHVDVTLLHQSHSLNLHSSKYPGLCEKADYLLHTFFFN